MKPFGIQHTLKFGSTFNTLHICTSTCCSWISNTLGVGFTIITYPALVAKLFCLHVVPFVLGSYEEDGHVASKPEGFLSLRWCIFRYLVQAGANTALAVTWHGGYIQLYNDLHYTFIIQYYIHTYTSYINLIYILYTFYIHLIYILYTPYLYTSYIHLIYILYTCTAQGGGGSFKNRKPIG